eukprot:2747294-Pleurochrysis_carterae.AAC.2
MKRYDTAVLLSNRLFCAERVPVHVHVNLICRESSGRRSSELVSCRFRPQYVSCQARPSSETGRASSFTLARFRLGGLKHFLTTRDKLLLRKLLLRHLR